MTTSQEQLFNKIMKLTPLVETKKVIVGRTTHYARKEYIFVNDNKVNFYDFRAHLDAIQKRNYLNRFCLSEISKDCDNRESITKEALESLDKEKNDYYPDFLVQCEYFIFATKTIFDTILKIIGYTFPGNYHRNFGKIEGWPATDIMKSLIGDQLDWFKVFNKKRNDLTHDTIAGISTNSHYNVKEDILTYSKRNLDIRNEGEQTGEVFKLPDYFDECFSRTNNVINRFYELLLKQDIKGNNSSSSSIK